jgi:hypothetical protein
MKVKEPRSELSYEGHWAPLITEEPVMFRMMTAAVAAIAIVVAIGSPSLIEPVHAACDPGDKIDSSTLNDARKKISTAGYQKVSNLRKGCDNYWHATAEKDGEVVYVVLSPAGDVIEEGN